MEIPMDKVKYKRAFLKLSGEALARKDENGEIREIFDTDVLAELSSVIKECSDMGVGFGIMIGAGNIWRGKLGVGVNRAKADHMGMLATTINCLRFQDALQKSGVDAVVMSAVPMSSFAEPFNYERAIEYMDSGRPVVFACGAGIPYISTDTAGVVRAREIDADVMLMAKNIDGVYSADPAKDPTAVRYKTITYDECIKRDIRALDPSAFAIAAESGIDIIAFSLKKFDAIKDALTGVSVGTLVTSANVECETY